MLSSYRWTASAAVALFATARARSLASSIAVVTPTPSGGIRCAASPRSVTVGVASVTCRTGIAAEMGRPADNVACAALARWFLGIPAIIRDQPEPLRSIDSISTLLRAGWSSSPV